MSPPTLRAALVAAAGPGFSLRRSLRAYIQAARASRRATGAPRPLRSRAALDTLLDRPCGAPPAPLAALAQDLRAVLRAGPAAPDEPTLDRIEAALQALTPATATAPLRLRHSGWPPGLGPALQARILGHPVPVPGETGPVAPAAAALVVHRLDGHELGGHTLRVAPVLPPDTVLPAPARDQRGDRGRRGRKPPWLSHLDEEGRRSLTPEAMARRHARLLGPVRVVEPCCGCGGNTVAFARAGATVAAWERDPDRARLARANLRDQGVAHRAQVQVGDGLAAAVNTDADAIFIDPPWELQGRRLESWGALCQALPGLDRALAAHPKALLKLPRRFAVATLPGGAAAWQLRYELGAAATGDAQVVRMITAARGLGGPDPAREEDERPPR